MKRVGTLCSLVATALVGMSTASVAQDSDYGAELYAQFCATCHGSDGKGAGPLTDLLTETVPQLTTLSAENEAAPGEFPMLNVIHIIDGRTGVRGHGGPMPVYGDIFSKDGHSSLSFEHVLETRGKILSLAYYLESIQE